MDKVNLIQLALHDFACVEHEDCSVRELHSLSPPWPMQAQSIYHSLLNAGAFDNFDEQTPLNDWNF
jgi:hypothetical protein